MAVGAGGGPANVAANVTANTAQFQSAMQTAVQSIQRLTQAVQQGGAPLSGMSQSLQQLVTAVNPAAAALGNLNQQFTQVARSAQTMGLGQATQLMNIIAQNANQATGQLGRMTGAMAGLQVANSGVVREFIVMGHEIATGNWTRLGGSAIVMAERLGGLASILSGITGSVIAIGAAGLAAAGGLAYMAYQMYEASASVTDTTSHLQLLGQGLEYSRDRVQEWHSQFQTRFRESSSAVRELTQYTDRMGPSASAQVPAIRNLVEAWAAIRREGLTDALKEFDKQFGTTVESFAKGATSIGALNALVEEHVKELIKGGQESEAWRVILQELQAQFGATGEAIADNNTKLAQWVEQMGALGEVGIPPMPQAGAFAEGPVPLGRRAETETERAGRTATAEHTAEIAKRKDLTDALTALKAREVQIEQNLQGLTEGVVADEAQRVTLNEELTRNLQAQKNIQTELPAVHGPAEVEAHRREMEQFAERIRRAQGDRDQIAAIRKDEAAAVARYAGEGTSAAVKAQDQYTDAVRTATNEQFRIWEDGMKRGQEAARHNVDEQIRIQQEIIDVMRSRTEEGQPFAQLHPEEYQSALTRLQQLQGQAADQAYQKFAASEREKVAVAKGNTQQILSIYDEWAARAAAIYGKDSVEFENIQREKVRAAQRAVEQAVSEAVRNTSAVERADSAYLEAFKSRMQEQVKLHQLTQEQALGFDIQYTAQLYTQLAARYQAILQNENATQDQKEEAYNRLLTLEADYTKQVTQDQEKIAAAANKTAKEIQQSFTQVFDQIGSGLERAITGALTGQRASPQEFLRSIVGGVVDMGGHILSRMAGEHLAPMLGVKPEEGQGTLGNVLGMWFTKLIGLAPEKSAQASLEASQASLKEVIAKSGNYTQDLTKAIQDLTQKITGTGAAGVTGKGGAGAGAGTGGGTAEAMTTGQVTSSAAMFSWLKQHGYSDTAAAAVIGNAMAESGLDTSRIGGAGELGLFQELGSRRTGLEQYAAGQGKPSTDWQVQMEYMDQELQKIDPAFKKAGDSAAQMTARFEHGFERPKSEADVGVRQGYADQVMQQQQQLTQSTQQNTQATLQNTQSDQQNTAQLSRQPAGGGGGGGGAGIGGGGGLLGNVQQLTGALGQAVPGLRIFSSALGTAQTALSAFSAMKGIGSAGAGLLGLGFLGLDEGGIIPSAAGGMIGSRHHTFPRVPLMRHPHIPSAQGGLKVADGMGGSLAVVHPEEMVLPRDLSRGLQNMINVNSAVSSYSPAVAPGGPGAPYGTSNAGNSLTYAPQITGRFGTISKTDLDNMLRTHGEAFLSYASNAMRNGWRG